MPAVFRLFAILRTPIRSLLHALLVVGVACGNLVYLSACASNGDAPTASASDSNLVELVGPIALYPDELLAIVLPASTFPLQVVQAARLLDRIESEPGLKPDDDWDESIIGIMNYPEIVQLMNDDLDWTWKLGDAVVNDQTAVMDAVQNFRAQVDGAGNLASNDKITVTRESPAPGELEIPEGEAAPQIVVIESASPEVIFVPVYQPTVVVVRHVTPVRWWWSPAHPFYFHPHAMFWTGMFIGTSVGWGLSWGWGPRWHHHHRSSVTVNRNINVNVNRPTRPGTPNRPGRPGDRPGGGGNWQPDRGPGRPGGGRPGGGERPGVGQRPGVGERPGVGQRPGAGERPRAGGGSVRPDAGRQRPAAGTGNRATGRDLTSQRGNRGSSMGNYNRSSSTRAASTRGAASRNTGARAGGGGGARGGGGSRGGGGGSRGGGRR